MAEKIKEGSFRPILSRQQAEKAEKVLGLLEELYWELRYPEILEISSGEVEIGTYNIESIEKEVRFQLEAYYKREIEAFNKGMKIKNHSIVGGKAVVEKDKH